MQGALVMVLSPRTAAAAADISLTDALRRPGPQPGEPLLDVRPETTHLVGQRQGGLRGQDRQGGRAPAPTAPIRAPGSCGRGGRAIAELEKK